VRLFLFDIDGTLVSARGAGRVALAEALVATYGTAGDIDRYDFRGKTDPRIVLDLMRGAGIRDDVIQAGMSACFDAYVAVLDRRLGDGARVTVLPGVADVVRALAARDDALVGLLTGNIEAGARLKLRSTGLTPLFRVGAFGSDSMDRRRLPAVACERARALAGREFPFERVTIIGDTPLDVDCARACGAVAVAVATGQHPHAELAACEPDLLFPDLSDVAAALAALVGR
jgi:phosphoglycolate phosphatase-like HAD superfamily hydrolase